MRAELARYVVDHDGYLLCLDCNLDVVGQGGDLAAMVAQAMAHNRGRHTPALPPATTFDPEDIPVANDYSRDDFGTDDEVRGWNLCREYVIAMFRGDDPRT